MRKVLVMLAMIAAVSGNAFAQSATYQVRLEQMHCGGCSGRVKQALTAVDGVQEVKTDLEKRIATISYDASKTSGDKLLSLLKTTTKFTEAYAYNPDEVIERKAIFRAGQIRCGGCASKIKKSIGEVAGVQNVDVDVDKKLVTIQYDANKVSKKEIVDDFKKAGYFVTAGYTNDIVKYASYTVETAKGRAAQDAIAKLNEVKGILDVNINPENGYTAISYNTRVIADDSALAKAIETAGYKAQTN